MRVISRERRSIYLLVLLALLGTMLAPVVVGDEGASAGEAATATTDKSSERDNGEGSDNNNASSPSSNDMNKEEQEELERAREERQKKRQQFNVHEHLDWGTYYDPQNVFCGKFDCYRILGFDYESFGKDVPDRKVITKRYRSLSREWHPDKSKHKDAKERFVKIARAYEVLTDDQQRAEYDFMRYDQEAYYQKYGASVLWSYAPKSDATYIIAALFVLVNWFTWIAQQQKWQRVADRLIKAAVEDWSPSQGGTAESKQLREDAIKVMAEREQQSNSSSSSGSSSNGKEENNAASSSPSKAPKGKGKASKDKVSGKEKKRMEQENIKPIVKELVFAIDNFGAGFHKPTWKDLFAIQLMKFPIALCKEVWWQSKFYIRRLQKMALNETERLVLTERAVGQVSWELASEEERKEMIGRELWKMDNLVEWKEEQEVKTWSKADQKHYQKMKKKGIKEL